jgi:hypothetical protein
MHPADRCVKLAECQQSLPPRSTPIGVVAFSTPRIGGAPMMLDTQDPLAAELRAALRAVRDGHRREQAIAETDLPDPAAAIDRARRMPGPGIWSLKAAIEW